ncbi:MAG: gamma-glutamyl-gamma-aminobutyrate hydrolase family protein, partial [Oscillospiraceae bacterium]
MKPIIGITDNYIKDDQAGIGMHIGGKNQHWHMLADDYVTAVQLAGGIPVILPTMAISEDADKILQTLDGIIFSGGSDINPLLYGEDAQEKIGQISLERDRHELSLLKRALEGNIGILGI